MIRAVGNALRPETWRTRPAVGGGLALAAACLPGFLLGCGGEEGGLRGHVEMDGSSTVYPIAEAVSEEFQLENPRVMVAVGRSGTGGGLERFCRGETDIATASRTIQEFEADRCRAAGVDFMEIPIALDGISVIVNPANTFLDCLTVEELRRIWRPRSLVRTWRDVRPEFPGADIQLYAPGTDSGTFDYFTEVIVGEAGATRMDFQGSEDDNVLVQGVSGDRYSLGYLGFAYVMENRQRVKVIAVDGGGGCITPAPGTIRDGSYQPLSRRLYVYVSRSSLQRPGMQAFMEYFLTHAPTLIRPTGFLPLQDATYRDHLERARNVWGDGPASNGNGEGKRGEESGKG